MESFFLRVCVQSIFWLLHTTSILLCAVFESRKTFMCALRRRERNFKADGDRGGGKKLLFDVGELNFHVTIQFPQTARYRKWKFSTVLVSHSIGFLGKVTLADFEITFRVWKIWIRRNIWFAKLIYAGRDSRLSWSATFWFLFKMDSEMFEFQSRIKGRILTIFYFQWLILFFGSKRKLQNLIYSALSRLEIQSISSVKLFVMLQFVGWRMKKVDLTILLEVFLVYKDLLADPQSKTISSKTTSRTKPWAIFSNLNKLSS